MGALDLYSVFWYSPHQSIQVISIKFVTHHRRKLLADNCPTYKGPNRIECNAVQTLHFINVCVSREQSSPLFYHHSSSKTYVRSRF